MANNSGDGRRVYQDLARDLRSAGVEAAFGLMSDDTALFITALEAEGIRFFGTRHENNAVAMAEGYAAGADRLGVAVIGRGPGTANCINALVHVSRTRAPVLVVMGEAPRKRRSPNGFGPDYKGLDGQRLVSAIDVPVFVATSGAGAQAALCDALEAALAGQAAALLLPADVQLAQAGSSSKAIQGLSDRMSAPKSSPARDSAVEVAAALLSKARRPLIIAGYGAYRAGAKDAIEELADRTGALLTTSLRAKDLFRGNPWEMDIAGSFSTSVGRRHAEQADCVLVIGANLNLLTSSFGEFFPEVPLIQVDLDRGHIGRYCHADLALIGDALSVTRQLLDHIPDRGDDQKLFRTPAVRDEIAAFEHSNDFTPAHTDWTVDMRMLALALDGMLPPDRDLVYDMGNFFAVAPFISVPDPGCLRYTGDFGSIGLGMGTALGVAAAGRGRPTCLLIGDGSLLMTLGELETMAREDLPLVVLVFNDHAYGAERHYLALRDQPFGKSIFTPIDFVPLAENLGIEAYSVHSMAELDKIADKLRSPGGPLLVDFKINPAIPAPFLTEFARLEGA